MEEFNKAKNKFYEKKNGDLSYALKDPASFITDLTNEIDREKTLLKQKENFLLSLVNSMPQDPAQALKVQLEREGGEKNELVLDDLIFLYLHGSEKEILSHCPGLDNNPNHCKTLLNKVQKYLVLATQQQQRKRALSLVQDLQELQSKQAQQKDDQDLGKELDNTNAELYAILSAKREYTPSLYPELLVFEYQADLLLKKEQFRVISLLLNSKNNPLDPSETEVIVQLIMGAGKTKVLLPILAAKYADGHKLSMLIVPNSLLETNRQDLKLTLKGTLHKEPFCFEFDRNTPTTEEELRNKLWSLQNAILHRNCIVTTAENLLCVKLKYQELLHQVAHNQLKAEEAEPKIKLLKEMYELFKTRGWAVLDEADTILSSRREVNFPLGSYKSVPKERTQLVQKIYKVLLDPKWECWTQIRRNKPETFSKKNFLEHVAPEIVQALISDWPLNSINLEDLKKFMLGQLEEQELPGLDQHPQRNLISLAKELIVTFIPFVLSKKGNEHFGLSHETNRKYPVPYKANNTPEETSEFGNIYETLLYAANIYSQDGLKDVHLDELIQETCRKIRLESKEQGCRFKETKTFQAFNEAFEIQDLFALNSADRKMLSETIKSKHNALFYWLMHFVYPEIQTTRQKISANALSLVDMLAHVQGFTGTPWNRPTYHDRFQKPDREAELSSPESELRILHALYQKVKKGGIHVLEENTPKEVLSKILQDFQFDCLVDVGALLNGITNPDVAQELKTVAEKQGLRGVIYFNEKNELVVELNGMTKPIK
jgi:Protein of unknown function (DUF3638)